MNKSFRETAAGLAVAAGLFLCGIFAAGIFSHPPGGSQDWAAWVQAVGSIGAILAAIWILRRQNEEAIRRADKETFQLIQSIGDEIETRHMPGIPLTGKHSKSLLSV